MKDRSYALLMPGPEQRASARRGAAKATSVYAIEGENVTAERLAERLGVGKNTALERLRRARSKPGPVTWARLGVA